MYKYIKCISIFLITLLPAVSSAAALEKYTVPQQGSGATHQPDTTPSPGYVDESVYDDFERKISEFKPDQLHDLKDRFKRKLEKAKQAKNKGAKRHYRVLINIINEKLDK